MIFRLSEKLNAKIKAGTLASLPPDENPFADWSAGLFVVGRTQHILLSNTKSLYSTVHYPAEEFWRRYNGPVYEELKAAYDPYGRLPDLYDKVSAKE